MAHLLQLNSGGHPIEQWQLLASEDTLSSVDHGQALLDQTREPLFDDNRVPVGTSHEFPLDQSRGRIQHGAMKVEGPIPAYQDAIGFPSLELELRLIGLEQLLAFNQCFTLM
jgi:hypothetical protein